MILERENKTYSVKAKTEAPYALEVCKVLEGKTCVIGQIAKDNAVENELYVDGIQNKGYTEKFFKNAFSKNKTEMYFTIDDLDMSPLGIIKMVYKAMNARLNKVDNYSTIELVDEKSKQEQKRYIIELETLLEMQDVMKNAVGADVLGPRLKSKSKLNDYTPKTIEELQFYQKIGYKNSIEVLLEKHLDIINNGNNYNFEVNPMVNRNLIISGMAATHVFFDNENRVCEEPIHIKDLKVVGGTKRNYEDAMGYVIDQKYSIDGFYEMVKGSVSTTSVNSDGEIVRDSTTLNSLYDTLKQAAGQDGNINVKLCYWTTEDDYSMKVCFNEKDETVLRNHNGAAHVKNTVQRWYKAYYVPVISSVYNHGPIPNMSRKKYNGKIGNAYSPVTVLRGLSKNLETASPIYSIRKIENIANVLWVKLQNEIARMKPTRTDIDIRALAETTELLKIAMPNIQSTDVLHALNLGLGLTTHATLDNRQTNTNAYGTRTYPVEIVEKYFSVINVAINWCFNFAGTPRVDVGISQEERKSNYSTKAELNGADKAILELFEIKDELIRFNAEKKANMVIRLYQSQDKIPNPYCNLFDDYEVKMLADVDFAVNREFTVKIDKGFSEEDILEIKQNLAAQNQRFIQTQGNDGLDFSDNLTILEILKESPKLARYKIQILCERRKKEAKEYAMQQMKQNQESQMQSAQAAQQGEAKLLMMQQQMAQMQNQFLMQFETLKSSLQIKEDTNKIMLEHEATVKQGIQQNFMQQQSAQ